MSEGQNERGILVCCVWEKDGREEPVNFEGPATAVHAEAELRYRFCLWLCIDLKFLWSKMNVVWGILDGGSNRFRAINLVPMALITYFSDVYWFLFDLFRRSFFWRSWQSSALHMSLALLKLVVWNLRNMSGIFI